MFAVITISVQVSSLIRSLLLVPSRVILIVSLNLNLVYSGFMCYIFIIIFIGGLMVLLVRVSSTVVQEQGVFPRIFLSLLIILLIGVSYKYRDMRVRRDLKETIRNLIMFLSFFKVGVCGSLLLILTVSLFILTKLLLDYKGLTRNL